jgi:hypothetical protein
MNIDMMGKTVNEIIKIIRIKVVWYDKLNKKIIIDEKKIKYSYEIYLQQKGN